MSPSSPAPAPSATTTIVTCIEAGFMERQVPLLVKSLRRFDHVLARAQVLAIQPRKGPAISGATRRELTALGIEHVRADLVGSYAWYNNLNKSAAMAWADRNCTTDFITWLDADMVFLGPTPEVVPGLGTSFVARAGEGSLGSDGADRNAPYWERISQIVGIDYKAAEIIDSLPEGRPIYEYYQSGVYSQARRDGIGVRHFEFMKKVLDASVGSIVARNYHYDQVTISMAARTGRGLRKRLAWEDNYNVNPLALEKVDHAMLRRCRVLHYHGGLYPAAWGRFQAMLDEIDAESRELIREYAPLELDLPPLQRLHRALLTRGRKRRHGAHARAIQLI